MAIPGAPPQACPTLRLRLDYRVGKSSATTLPINSIVEGVPVPCACQSEVSAGRDARAPEVAAFAAGGAACEGGVGCVEWVNEGCGSPTKKNWGFRPLLLGHGFWVEHCGWMVLPAMFAAFDQSKPPGNILLGSLFLTSPDQVGRPFCWLASQSVGWLGWLDCWLGRHLLSISVYLV